MFDRRVILKLVKNLPSVWIMLHLRHLVKVYYNGLSVFFCAGWLIS